MQIKAYCPKCSDGLLHLAWRRKRSNQEFALHRICKVCKRRWVATDLPNGIEDQISTPDEAKQRELLFDSLLALNEDYRSRASGAGGCEGHGDH